MNGLSINTRDGASPKLRNLMDRVSPKLRARLHRSMGRAVQNLCRNYLINVANTRHDTANKLGGTPTGFFGYAAEAAGQPQALSADSAGATLTIVHPGIGRVGHDVTITAGTQTPGVKLLTIPIDGAAYGYRIMQGESPRFPKGFWFTSKKGNKIYGVREGKDIHPLYVGKESVTLKQDRSLLPSDEAIMQTALNALTDDLQEVADGVGEEIQRRTE